MSLVTHLISGTRKGDAPARPKSAAKFTPRSIAQRARDSSSVSRPRDGSDCRSSRPEGDHRSRALSQPLPAFVKERRRPADRSMSHRRRDGVVEEHKMSVIDRPYAGLKAGRQSSPKSSSWFDKDDAIEKQHGRLRRVLPGAICAFGILLVVVATIICAAVRRLAAGHSTLGAQPTTRQNKSKWRCAVKQAEPPSIVPCSRPLQFQIGRDSRGTGLSRTTGVFAAVCFRPYPGASLCDARKRKPAASRHYGAGRSSNSTL